MEFQDVIKFSADHFQRGDDFQAMPVMVFSGCLCRTGQLITAGCFSGNTPLLQEIVSKEPSPSRLSPYL